MKTFHSYVVFSDKTYTTSNDVEVWESKEDFIDEITNEPNDSIVGVTVKKYSIKSMLDKLEIHGLLEECEIT